MIALALVAFSPLAAALVVAKSDERRRTRAESPPWSVPSARVHR